jgi:GNAT superfamily N-acetyltransferase
MSLIYRSDRPLTVAEFTDVLVRSTLGERRPIDDPERLAAMLEHADLLCTAWEGDRLVGVSRSITDFAYCCYLSDLAVDVAYQGQGVGTELIRLTQSRLHPRCNVILLAAPKAREYYPRIGFTAHPSAWVAPAHPPLDPRGNG